MRNKTHRARRTSCRSRAGHAYRRQTGGLSRGRIPSVFLVVTLAVMALCVCVGSVSLPLKETLTVIWNAVFACRCRKASRRRSFSRCACRACFALRSLARRSRSAAGRCRGCSKIRLRTAARSALPAARRWEL